MPSQPDLLATIAAVGMLAWFLGSVFLGVRLIIGQRRMRRLRASAVPAAADATVLCQQVAERMRVSAPEVLKSPFLFSPCLDGVLRPVILLPEDAEENLLDTFVHELAHLVRHDGLWNLLGRVTTAALWVQPLLWVLSRRLESTAEEVCDDHVVQFGADRVQYAGQLVELAGRSLPPTAATAVGMIALRSTLARRVLRNPRHLALALNPCGQRFRGRDVRCRLRRDSLRGHARGRWGETRLRGRRRS